MQLKTPAPTVSADDDTVGPPVLCLYPLNGWAREPKRIPLTQNPVVIGRHTSVTTAPKETNGFFSSKVLSRAHAAVWAAGGKIFLRDTKSSHGTYINDERLSDKGRESEPCELKSGDIVEFGIDMLGADNKMIIHRGVAARVECVNVRENENVEAAHFDEHYILLVRNFSGRVESRQWIHRGVQVGSDEAREQ